ncbi:MAG: 1-deoxy-D-xylulose-5-phosphate synthase, partial [Desulfobacter sp.]
FKTFVTPGMLFEAFNFDYFGPIDGHNLDHLIDILSNIKDPDSPVLLHVTTKKGKGYAPAEKNPVYFHGVGAFAIDTGKCPASKNAAPSYTSVFGKCMIELAKQNPCIVAVTAAMPEGTGLKQFAEHFADRFIDVGIAEQHAVTFAAGLAAKGAKPVVAIYSTFLQRAYDQILHDVCIDSHPVIFAIDRGGIVGEDGPTHHGLFDFSYLRSIPNMTVMAPMDENELVRMMQTAVAHQGPIALRYPRGAGQGVDVDYNAKGVDIGKAKVLRTGDDLLIIGIGRCVNDAMDAAELLSAQGIESTVVNARFVKPLDGELILDLAGKIKNVVTIEENVLAGGFGSAILELICDNGVSGCRVNRVGVNDVFIEHGSQNELRKDYGIDARAVVAAGLKLCGEK